MDYSPGRLHEELKAAKERGDVACHSSGRPKIVPDGNDLPSTHAEMGTNQTHLASVSSGNTRPATHAEIGITRKQVCCSSRPSGRAAAAPGPCCRRRAPSSGREGSPAHAAEGEDTHVLTIIGVTSLNSPDFYTPKARP